MKRTLFPALLLLPLAAACGCGKGEGVRTPKMRVYKLPLVEFVKPQRITLTREVELAATVDALQKSDLMARVPGKVELVRKDIDIGRRISKGERLMRLAVPDLEADKAYKEAMVEQAERQVRLSLETLAVAQQEAEEAKAWELRYVADLKYQQGRYERFAGLVREGAQEKALAEEAKRQMESAQAARDAAAAVIRTKAAKARAAAEDLELARRKVDVARADVKKLDEMIKLGDIIAPFDGVIVRRHVDEGATIKDAGTPLLSVMQLHRVRVLIDVPQKEAGLVDASENVRADAGLIGGGLLGAVPRQGDPALVQIPELAERVSNGEFHGHVTRVSGALDPVTRTMRAEIELPNDGEVLKPGMYGKAKVTLESRFNVLTIPASALVRKAEGKLGVYVVDNPHDVPPRGELKFVEVERGIDNGEMVEVRKGLKGDEMVVAKGNGVLRHGEVVRPVTRQED